MPTFENILVPTDYGAAAQRAADIAAGLAAKLSARMTLLHVMAVPFPSYAPGVGGAMPVEAVKSLAEESLDVEASRVRRAFPELKTLLLPGYPYQTILEAVAEHGFDVIVMGTHGRHGVERLLTGSVAEKVVRASPVPVLTVHAPDLGR